MRKNIELEVAGQTFKIAVNMRVIEVIERVYDQNVDMVVGAILADPSRIKLTQLAEVVINLIADQGAGSLTRSEVKEYVYTLDSDGLSQLIGSVQAAALFFRNHITEDQFDQLAAGHDLEDEPVDEAEGAEKK